MDRLGVELAACRGMRIALAAAVGDFARLAVGAVDVEIWLVPRRGCWSSAECFLGAGARRWRCRDGANLTAESLREGPAGHGGGRGEPR